MTYTETKQRYSNVSVIYIMQGDKMLEYAINPATGNEFFSPDEAEQYITNNPLTDGKTYDIWDDASDFLDDLVAEEQ